MSPRSNNPTAYFLLLVLAGCGNSTPETIHTVSGCPLDGGTEPPPDGSAGGKPTLPIPDAGNDANGNQCAHHNPLRNPYFGDLHVHTRHSIDAYLFDTRNSPREAYAFAKGQEVGLAPLDEYGQTTRDIVLDRPLDFAAATDHSEFIGETEICTNPDMIGYDSQTCQLVRDNPMVAFADMLARLGLEDPSHPTFCGVGGVHCLEVAKTVWQRNQDMAEEAYDRCSFTTFIAYEWTGTPLGANIHRNIFFANSTVPELPTSYIDEPTPVGLWNQLKAHCLDAANGCDVISIPHNSNASKGEIFDPQEAFGSTLTQSKAEFWGEMEPLVEMIQHKGGSECTVNWNSPDEACGFEQLKEAADVPHIAFVREALKEGLRYQTTVGANPFKFGFISSTDTHNGTPGAVEEHKFQGHGGNEDATVQKRFLDRTVAFNPGGLAVVWAEENTREALFAGMKRKETYATSGTRPVVRFFGGWNYPTELCDQDGDTLLSQGYSLGVPMGGDLPPPIDSGPPVFVVSAMYDPGTDDYPGTRLQRIQIIKAWVADGETHEQVFDVAGDKNNGASVDLKTCQTHGDSFESLCAVWTDPDFDPDVPALYYARVLENPSCRWHMWTCINEGIDCDNGYGDLLLRKKCCSDDEDAPPQTIQERAWTSPIWYTP